MGFGWFCLLLAYFNDVSYSWYFNWKVYSVEWEIRAEQGLSGFAVKGSLFYCCHEQMLHYYQSVCGQVYVASFFHVLF